MKIAFIWMAFAEEEKGGVVLKLPKVFVKHIKISTALGYDEIGGCHLFPEFR